MEHTMLFLVVLVAGSVGSTIETGAQIRAYQVTDYGRFHEWSVHYVLMNDGTVVGNVKYSNHTQMVDSIPDVLGQFWGSTPQPEPIAFYRVATSGGTVSEAAHHSVMTTSGRVYARWNLQQPTNVPAFEGTEPVFIGEYWSGDQPAAQIIDYQVFSHGTANEWANHYVLLADGNAYMHHGRHSVYGGPRPFDSSTPILMGTMWSGGSPVPTKHTSWGAIKDRREGNDK